MGGNIHGDDEAALLFAREILSPLSLLFSAFALLPFLASLDRLTACRHENRGTGQRATTVSLQICCGVEQKKTKIVITSERHVSSDFHSRSSPENIEMTLEKFSPFSAP